ncbi:MAG: amino acid racemase [Candidatus Micrarchaeia archaeon]|jgi:aspartate racemase
MGKDKVIGIMAGMGPKSTAPFIDLVVKECQRQYGARYDEDFPHILIYSLPTPFYLNKPIDHAKMKGVLCIGLKKLESCGVDFIAMPSNSPHVYFNELKKCVKVPLLNIIDETIQYLGKKPLHVALLATRTTVESRLYQDKLEKKGHTIIENEAWQEKLDWIIGAIKKGTETSKIIKKWNELIKLLKKERIDTAILACTDLNVVCANKKNGLHIIDSSECLAKAVVRTYLEG